MFVRYNFCDVRSKDAAIIMCILSSLSKIYEYVVFEQLLLYMEDNGLFYNDQFGFRSGHSTELASVRFVDTLVQQMDNFNIPISILIDLSKAFDTLDHNIMLSKLRHIWCDRYFLRRRYILHKETNLQKKLHTYFTKSIYTYNGDAIHNIHAGSLRTTSYRSL